jgi:hypothetical protein
MGFGQDIADARRDSQSTREVYYFASAFVNLGDDVHAVVDESV